MKITRRQETFITNLIDLSDQVDGPIHYSTLAERLGVSPFTAYDMLCLLEEKGLVTSEYQLAADKHGPGRTERLFYPSLSPDKRNDMLVEAFGGRIPGKEEHKKLVMTRVHSGGLLDNDLAVEVLARLLDVEDGKISYCVEIMSIVAVRLQRTTGRKLLLKHWSRLLPTDHPTCADLSLQGGFAFGLLAQECGEDDNWIQKLFEHIQKYLSIVQQLNPQECNQLADALSEVFETLYADKYDR